MFATTTTIPKLVDGRIVLEVHYLDADRELHVTQFDVDMYTIELAGALINKAIEQRDSTGIV